VYVGRNAVLFSHAPQTLAIVALIGAATALFASTIGLVQNDIKRVLAYARPCRSRVCFSRWASARTRRHLPSPHAYLFQGVALLGSAR
jgi:hypothetical protein